MATAHLSPRHRIRHHQEIQVQGSIQIQNTQRHYQVPLDRELIQTPNLNISQHHQGARDQEKILITDISRHHLGIRNSEREIRPIPRHLQELRDQELIRIRLWVRVRQPQETCDQGSILTQHRNRRHQGIRNRIRAIAEAIVVADMAVVMVMSNIVGATAAAFTTDPQRYE